MNRQNSKYVRVAIKCLAALTLALAALLTSGVAAYAEQKDLAQFRRVIDAYGNQYRFSDFMRDYADQPRPDAEYIINGGDYTRVEGMEPAVLADFEGEPGASVWTDEDGFIEWTVNIDQPGVYNLSVLYYSIAGKNSDVQRSLFIDGELPYLDAGTVEFSRTWVNELDVWKVDNRGNDLRPTQIEAPSWRETPLKDPLGAYNEPYTFYLSQGQHTITFLSQREPMVIRYIKLHQLPTAPSYAEYKASNAGVSKPANQYINIQGEDANRKSSPMLYPTSDKSSPAVTPYSAKEIKNNNIGDGTWDAAGMWIEWDFEVYEDGLYKIAMSLKQNAARGTNSYRRVYVDGEVPFKEMEAVGFSYESSWRVETLGAENDPYLFYLTKGVHTLRMEVVLGDYAEYMREIEASVLNMNSLYRELVMITGLSPDTFRDYQIARKLPHLYGELYAERQKMIRIYDELTALSGGRGERDTVIRTMGVLLETLYKNIEEITKRQGTFKTNIGSLGTWIMEVRSQSLAIDEIYVLSADASTPKINNGWFDKLKHEIVTLFYSFIIDYNSIGNVSEGNNQRKITTWVGGGRDQANSIKALIDENFTVNSNISVNLMLVDMGTLLPATLSGQGPDVAMMVGNDLPMNYAMRGAVTDMATFSDFGETSQRFLDSALVPYRFRNSCFALPETQSFNMLFYRKDILYELGLEPPDTWEDVKAALSVLSKNYMRFGIPLTSSALTQTNAVDNIYAMFLYQSGGQFYNDDGTASALDSDISISVFKEFTKYYSDYRLSQAYDFSNLFRTGEMPMAINDYTAYNQLQVFAPEIRGLWGFKRVPGTIREDGTIDYSVATGGSAVVIMEKAKDKQAAWEYVKWWTSADTQTGYGRALEALMGPAARWPTANQEAFERLPWPVADSKNLKEQFQYAKGIPQVPGGYFTARQINNAFYKVVSEQKVGPREALTDYVRYINDEIAYKRKEFGLD